MLRMFDWDETKHPMGIYIYTSWRARNIMYNIYIHKHLEVNAI
jgi:hypothetical protein